MKPAPFDYFLARDINSAVRALASASGEAKLLAGGQSLVPMLNFRLLRPSLLTTSIIFLTCLTFGTTGTKFGLAQQRDIERSRIQQ